MFAGVQDDRFLQPGAETFFELAKTAEVFAANPGACLYLDTDYLAIVAFQHEVDFVAGFGAEVPGGDRRVLRGKFRDSADYFRVSRHRFPCLRQVATAIPCGRARCMTAAAASGT
jgi:hypothetical protein